MRARCRPRSRSPERRLDDHARERRGSSPEPGPRHEKARREQQPHVMTPGRSCPGSAGSVGRTPALTRFISAISSGDSSIGRNGAFEKPMPCSPLIDPSSATTPSNSTFSASCARSISSASSGDHHDVDVDVAVAGMAEARDAQPVGVADAPDQREQLRDAALRHDHVVIELQRRDHLQRQRQLAAHAPQLLRVRLRPSRAGPRSRRRRRRPLRRGRLLPRPPSASRPLRAAGSRRCPPAPANGR